MGYKHNDSCLEKVGEDEPIFVLRAKDRLAPTIVEAWLMLAASTLTSEKYKETINLISKMKLWQANNSDKVRLPD